METQWFVVYCSPAGSTRHVGDVIAEEIRTLPAEAQVLDLGKVTDWSAVSQSIRKAGDRACVFIGSPVYRDLAVPLVMKFIEALPSPVPGFAVPFVTWGAAASGIALWQMGTALQDKGFRIAAAAKVLGVHSLMWGTSEPLGKGHPDAADDETTRELVRSVRARLGDADFAGIPLSTLDYQPADRVEEMKAKLGQPFPTTPRIVNESACTQCEVCANECPAGAITMDPFPRFSENCIDCFNCIHHCPEAAIEPKMSLAMIEERIRNRSAMMNESKAAQIW